MSASTRIYLTGFMASGKSTVGPIVANVLGYEFTDLDEAIEQHAGRPIPLLFQEEGEARFREMEAEVLDTTMRRERLVVATGGGALAREPNLGRALLAGIVVYLYVEPAYLVRRLSRMAGRRPLLQDETGTVLPADQLRRKVLGLLEQRAPFYEQAHLTIDTTRQRLGHTVDAVVRAVRSFEG